MKVFARQIEPDYQESPLTLGDENFPDNIAVFGNRDYKEHMPDYVRNAREVLREGKLAELFIEGWHDKRKEATDYLPPEKVEYSDEDIEALEKLVLQYAKCSSREKDSVFCSVLSIVTGKKWDYKIIRCYCQSDWNYIYYPTDEWTTEGIEAFEVEYFNTGSEWSVHYDEEMEGCNYNIYCHSCYYDDIKKEIAGAEGIDPAEVVLYAFVGWTRAASYKKV